MANYAALIDVLSVAGSRLSDGTPNASGTVWFFRPGTNTPVNAYSDAAATTVITQPVTLTSGGLLNTSDFPNGIFVTQPVRLLVQDVSGNSVVDTTYIPATAGDTGLSNAGWTDSTVDGAFTKLYASLGGQDGKYLIATGQTPLTYQSALTAISINVKAFGAAGDGIAIDTTAIQAALNYAKAAGGGIVLLPPGTYKIDQALTLTSATGVTILGSGMGATTITSTHATANIFTISSCTSIAFEGFNTKNSGTSTGSAFSLTSVTTCRFIDVGVNGFDATAGTYRFGVSSTSSGPLMFQSCRMTVVTGDAAARCVLLTASSGTVFVGGFYCGNSGYNWELTGATSSISAIGVTHNGSSVRFAAGLTLSSGYRYMFAGGTGLFFSVATSTLPYIMQLNCSDVLSGSGTTSATGSSQTPVLYNGREVLLAATSGGAGTVTVNAPAILPGTDSADTDLYWDFVFKNAAGGAVTWTLNAVFVTTAAVPATDGHTISVRFRWDRTTSKLREVSRADTVT